MESILNIQTIAGLGCEKRLAEAFYSELKGILINHLLFLFVPPVITFHVNYFGRISGPRAKSKRNSHFRGLLVGLTKALPIFVLGAIGLFCLLWAEKEDRLIFYEKAFWYVLIIMCIKFRLVNVSVSLNDVFVFQDHGDSLGNVFFLRPFLGLCFGL